MKFAEGGKKRPNVLPMFNLRAKMKKPDLLKGPVSLSSGGWIRTNDLWVMSPTSYHCSTPQYVFNMNVSSLFQYYLKQLV
jgi:hypothetical protein